MEEKELVIPMATAAVVFNRRRTEEDETMKTANKEDGEGKDFLEREERKRKRNRNFLFTPREDRRPYELVPRSESFGDESEPRVDRLKKMVHTLKRIESSLRSVGGDFSPPSIAEIRLYNLIATHVVSCIYLHHKERADSALVLFSRSLLERAAAAAATATDPAREEEDVRSTHVRLYSVLQESYAPGYHQLVKALLKYRSSSTATCTTSASAVSKDEDQYVSECRTYLQLLREQQLLDILYTLRKMAKQRNYTPPGDGEEILHYKEIRKWITSSSLFVQAKVRLQLHSSTGATHQLWRTLPGVYPEIMGDFDCVPSGYRIAAALELIPQFRSLIKECKYRLTQILPVPTPESERAAAKDEAMDGDDCCIHMKGEVSILTPQVRRISEAEQKAVEEYRLQCLRDILSKCKALVSLFSEDKSPSPPTIEEIRLYTQIEQRVNSSIWLFLTAAERRQGNGRCQNFDPDNDSLPVEATQGAMQNREEYLRAIVTLFEALESSSLVAVPTQQEVAYFKSISWMLGHNFVTSSDSLRQETKAMDGMDEINPPTVTDKIVGALKNELMYVYNRELEFFEEAKRETTDILDMVHGSIDLGNQDLENSVCSVTVSEEMYSQIAVKLECFFRELSPGSHEQLDQCIAVLGEIRQVVGDVLFRLNDANNSVATDLHVQKKYEKVVREINSVCYISTPGNMSDLHSNVCQL